MNKITAYRDGQQREFTSKVWEAMGIGHCGWTAVPEVPKEVAKAVLVGNASTLTGRTDFDYTAASLAPAVPKEVNGYGVAVKSSDFKPRKTRQKK